MKRLKTAAQARAEGFTVGIGPDERYATSRTSYGEHVEVIETERETYWADRCEALEREIKDLRVTCLKRAQQAIADRGSNNPARSDEWCRGRNNEATEIACLVEASLIRCGL